MMIGLTGPAYSGKDTAGTFLTQAQRYTRFAFADALKESLLALDPLIPVERRWRRTRYVRLSVLVKTEGWDAAKKIPEVRALLQRMGTEVGRNVISPLLWPDGETSLWVEIVMRQAVERSVFTDVRFDNEAEAIRRAGGMVVAVNRPSSGLDGKNAEHVSESGINPALIDAVVNNDGSTTDLGIAVVVAARHHAWNQAAGE